MCYVSIELTQHLHGKLLDRLFFDSHVLQRFVDLRLVMPELFGFLSYLLIKRDALENVNAPQRPFHLLPR